MTVEQIKQESLGKWKSIAAEVRPGSTKNADGTIKPFYLTREFTFLPNDKFELTVINFADPYGKVPLAKMEIKGHIEWQGEHPIAAGAQKVNFMADEAYMVTPLLKGFADVLNQYTKGFNEWKVGEAQHILGKAFAPFGLAEGQIFKEYDLIYLHENLMFWGARNVDGRGFDTEENRPTNLQIPMIRQY
jgi:Adenomatosis polyposis coli down-regulated 1